LPPHPNLWLGYNTTIMAAQKKTDNPADSLLYTPQEYIEAEKLALRKSEYISGHILAMAGASFEHNNVMVDTSRALGNLLTANQSPCEVHNSEQRVQISDAGPYFYPDISVVCGEPFVDQNDNLQNPIAIFEVLSPSTSDYDHGEKFFHYRRIESLKEYVLVHINTPLIEHYLRKENDEWILREIKGLDTILDLPTLSISIPLKEIYRRLTF
jgi:Uma2 family endonuclease